MASPIVDVVGRDTEDDENSDLANNNDPNNNAEDLNDPEAVEEPPLQPRNAGHVSTPPPPGRVLTPEVPMEVEEVDIYQALDDDVKLIQRLIHNKSYEEIRSHLEAYFHNPKRVQVHILLFCLFKLF